MSDDEAQPAKDVAELEKLAGKPYGFDDFGAPEVASTPVDALGQQGKAQTLFAMSDWERLAEREERSGLGANGRMDAISGAPSAHFQATDDPSLSWDEFAFRQVPGIPAKEPTFLDIDASPSQPQREQTVYWNPRLTTDPSGTCRIQFVVPPGPMAHRLTVIAHGNGRVGTTSQLIPTVVHSQSIK
jgi:hypothetical protein